MFELHPDLQRDTYTVGQFKLSLILLHKDANYPWLILVPKREKVREIHHLMEEEQIQLIKESSHLSEVMTSIYAPVKMNIAALGNIVPQLHIHHVARFKTDPTWPKPIWGAGAPLEYTPEKLAERLERLHSSLVGEDFQAICSTTEDKGSHQGFFTP